MSSKQDGLSDAQKKAIQHVSGLSPGCSIDTSLRINIHFHPDRTGVTGHVLEQLVTGDTYKSQFETNTSNGGLTAHPGGERWDWESRIFGTAYDEEPPERRPKYGSLNYKKDTYGGSPRFGSAYLRLKQQVVNRSTFCYPDSYFKPENFGTARHMNLVKIALDDDKDLLDSYIEAQVHGEIKISRDVEAIVLDPSYKGSNVEDLASRLGCDIEWHIGYVLDSEELARHADYRGPEFVEIGKKIAVGGILTPKIIGEAADSGNYDERSLKQVWHYVARYGRK